jgi:hypothetical protein
MGKFEEGKQGVESILDEFMELVNRYPSPHNGQPIRMKQTGEDEFTLYFQRERGLQAAGISFIFSFVSMGVFVKYIELCGRAFGHEVKVSPVLPSEGSLRGEGPIEFATMQISWNSHDEDRDIRDSLLFRQTSRKKYSTPGSDLVDKLLGMVKGTMKLAVLDAEQAKQAIWLNQRAVFDDMFDSAVNKELDHWLRYTKEEKEAKRDGLAYDCMEIDGGVMRYIVHHPAILRVPVLSWFIKQYYLRTMTDDSRVLYMLAPFKTERDAFTVGEKIMELWTEVAGHRTYLHPFGTIMSNHAAHQDFLKLVGVTNESRESSYLVFIFRLGMSEQPAQSLRLPYHDHLLIKEI